MSKAKTVRVKTDELEGQALNWAVAQANSLQVKVKDGLVRLVDTQGNLGLWYNPEANHAWAGPLAERERISVYAYSLHARTESGQDVSIPQGWKACKEPKAFWITPKSFSGTTPNAG